MEKTETHPWDPAEHLETDEDMAAYLEAALKTATPLSSLPHWVISPARRARRKSRAKPDWGARAFIRRSPPRATRSLPLCSRSCVRWGSGCTPPHMDKLQLSRRF